MNWTFSFRANSELYLKNPSDSDLGRRILQKGMEMMYEMGLEDFTLRKLALALNTNESSIYRYFENKNRLLQYYSEWYWRWLDYQMFVCTQNVVSPRERLDIIVELLTAQRVVANIQEYWLEGNLLRNLIIQEGMKSYLTIRVDEDNKLQLFKPYKELCGKIAAIISELNPDYPFPRAFASTLLEMAHHQFFFVRHLPSLTDWAATREESQIALFLKDLTHKLKP
jgi:AcrR family transcriptional regulator